jgi:hypothetical protein
MTENHPRTPLHSPGCSEAGGHQRRGPHVCHFNPSLPQFQLILFSGQWYVSAHQLYQILQSNTYFQAIALHTFAILILRWRTPQNLSKFIVLGIWVFTALVVGIPNAVFRHDVYYGADPGSYWCWIVNHYKAEQVVSEYLWVWSTAVALIILYGIMFLVIRGYVIIDEDGVHWHTNVRVHLDLSGGDTEEDRENKKIAKMMLLLVLFHSSHYALLTSNTAIQQCTSFASSPTPSPGGSTLVGTPYPTNSPSLHQHSTPSPASSTSSSSSSPAQIWSSAQAKLNSPNRPPQRTKMLGTPTRVNMGTYQTGSSRTRTRRGLYLISTRGACRLIITVRR